MKTIADIFRNQFPILETRVNGKPLIYFDNGATTQKPMSVIQAESQYYKELNSNVHRGVHFLSTQSTIAFEQARKSVQQFINAQSDHEVIFTRGTTESINLVAASFCQTIPKGHSIVVSEMEHHSNIVPWQLACKRFELVLNVVKITSEGTLDLAHLQRLLSNTTGLVAITHISNVLGTINPMKDIIAMAHAKNIPVLVDAAQSVAHVQPDVCDLDCDFMVFSSHKMYGPMGIGVLYGKEKWLEKMPPYHGGGEMIRHVSFEETTFNDLPFRFEAGTPNVAGALGLTAAIDFLKSVGFDAIHEHEQMLTLQAMQHLKSIRGMRIFGPEENHSSVISFIPEGIHPFDAGTLLDKTGIALRTGTHCAEPLMKVLGVNGTMRISFGLYNTPEEVDQFADNLQKIINLLS